MRVMVPIQPQNPNHQGMIIVVSYQQRTDSEGECTILLVWTGLNMDIVDKQRETCYEVTPRAIHSITLFAMRSFLIIFSASTES